jgi:hypothetical protein
MSLENLMFSPIRTLQPEQMDPIKMPAFENRDLPGNPFVLILFTALR